ncbi:Por secretion system C-terminal sorting domain-containing protein [Dyadobacter sp. SG02]|uniref:T9SS type A sorting domain-containing protein n=1 Tax=Dyadobacter sp. SG02 TaxID=1855291 RepID=UPI0008D5B014|nr:T9SS type A sorting domain-containing protein [Dyadobacter sp. SG02]SEJ59176.1 Por secretion system C-terminal sorting domain-containing protein [Dyadobacter sp. SG02]
MRITIRLLQVATALGAALLLLLPFTLSAQSIVIDSPAKLTTSVRLSRPQETNANSGFALFVSGAQVVAAFNKGRRSEETEFGFSQNALGIFSLPAGYDSFTQAQRALYIINAERQARAGMDYGNGPVSGRLLEGLETTLCNAAYDHAFYTDSTKKFLSIGRNGLGPYDRVDAAFQTGCIQRLGLIENMYSGPVSAYNVEAAIFTWLYQDIVGASRTLILLQKFGRYDWEGVRQIVQGFIDDHGPAGSEGILGIGVSNGIVVMDVTDPTKNAGCGFSFIQNPLPVHLISWNGSYQENVVKLNWETAWEENSDYFAIQRSADLKTFTTIGKVASKGTTAVRQSYEWTDADPEPGTNYYRLVQTDADGTTETSRIIAIHNEPLSSGKLAVYPNPSRPGEAFRVNVAANGAESIILYNLVGREMPILTFAEGDGVVLVKPAEPLPSGMYSVVVAGNGGRQYARVFVK